MYCKLCHKNVRSIGHWAREHRNYLARKSRRGGRRGGSKRGSSFRGKGWRKITAWVRR